ncbi:MAG: hypothetical protein PHN56_00845 [Candidatus Nanoarchaeia archaeon]|nr:hypothetical protein [Candidatus Nanoarchaeia archaeon]
MNKKSIEGLPLKYLIIILVAAVVIGMILDITGFVELGIFSGLDKINNTVMNTTNSLP